MTDYVFVLALAESSVTLPTLGSVACKNSDWCYYC